MATSAEELASQAQQLNDTVMFLKIENGSSGYKQKGGNGKPKTLTEEQQTPVESKVPQAKLAAEAMKDEEYQSF
jgi:hypothetical protein